MIAAPAQTNSWTNAAGGFWDNNVGFWSLGVSPSNTHSVFITNAGSKTVTIDSITASITNRMTVSNLTVANTGGATNTLLLNLAGTNTPLRILRDFTLGAGGALTINNSAVEVLGQSGGGFTNDGSVTMNTGLFTATNAAGGASVMGDFGTGSFQLNGGEARFNSLRVGNQAGSAGTFTQTGGTNSTATNLFLGFNGSASGTYNLGGGQLSALGLIVGQSGTGVFNQDGGVSAINSLTIGNQAVGSGTYNLSNGQLSANSGMIVGNLGTGVFNQSGGVSAVSGTLFLGNGTSGNGTYYLSNGQLSAANTSVGNVGTGVMNQSGGTFVASNSLILGDGAAGSGTYNLSNGVLNGFFQYLGDNGVGVFNQSGGTNTGNTILLGAISTGNGTYNFTNGLVSVNSTYVGEAGTGTFNQFGGAHIISNSLVVGDAPGSSGTYNLSNGVINASFETIGAFGAGVMNQTGGTNSVGGGGSVLLGQFNGSSGTYNLSNGLLTVNDFTLGNTGITSTGLVNQAGGAVVVTNVLVVGRSATGRAAYTISGGTLNAGFASIGSGGTGNYTQFAGTVSISGVVNVGNGPGSTGQVSVAGGSFAALTLFLGANGAGTITQTGGTNTVTTLNAGSGPSASALYTLNNGLLSAGTMTLGISGSGTSIVNQAGGSNLTAGVLSVGSALGSTARYSLNGGTVASATLIVGANGMGTWNQNGGAASGTTLTAGTNNAGTGQLNLSNGTLAYLNQFIGSNGIATVNHTGGNNTASTLTLGAGLGWGTYDLSGGSLTATSALVRAGSSFTQSGGTFTGTLTNLGTVTHSGGTFAGRLANFATFNHPASFTAGNGWANYVSDTIAGGTFTLNGQGLDNQGTITLANGAFAGNGGLTNNNFITGYGGIGGNAGFVNNGLLQVSGGTLVLSNTGANLNAGNLDIAAGAQLQLATGALSNTGTLNLAGGNVSGTNRLINAPGGIVNGRGLLSATLVNSGILTVSESGTLNVTRGFTNNGIVALGHIAANLGGGTITNASTIQGFGNVAASVTNTGTLEPLGGTLNFNGAVTASSNALITAATGNKIFFGAGLAVNPGVISLTGGTFDNNNRALQNNGQLTGYGVFRSGGLTNNGVATFAGGSITVNGNVTNGFGRTMQLVGNTGLFTGNVVNHGLFKTTDALVTFTGLYTENGTFLSDPSDNYFNDLSIGTAGVLVGGLGDRFFVSGNFLNAATNSVGWSTINAKLTINGAGAHTLQLPGVNFDLTSAGYVNNFGWGAFELAAGNSLVLQDGNGAAGGGMYVSLLTLGGGTNQISSITGNGLSIYYDARQPGNAYLGAKTYDLPGGGVVAPIDDTVRIIAITSPAPGTYEIDFNYIPGKTYGVQYSLNLTNWISVSGASFAFPNAITGRWLDNGSLTGGAANQKFYRISMQ